MLYHYTTQVGLLGILQTRELWATHVAFLNDSSEFQHALDFAKAVSARIFMEDDYMAAFGLVAREAIGRLSPNVFVASFSATPDLLSQWRGYCPAGAGFCLGFDTQGLQNFVAARGYRLEKCVYDKDHQAEAIRKIVAASADRFPAPDLTRSEFEALSPESQAEFETSEWERTSEGQDRRESSAAVEWLGAEVARLAPLFKNYGFHEEAEWRIVVDDPSRALRYRATNSYLAPYVELDVLRAEWGDVLKEIVIGPNPNQSRCEASVRMLLRSKGFENVGVKSSSTPLNNW